jgi:transcriptional regulator with XRE-family HTH domain
MAPNDKRFYQALGQRIAQFRKARNLTQQQLAEVLGISQQTIAHYEVGRLRIAVALLPALTKALDVSIEELLARVSESTRGRRGPAATLEKQIKQIRQLPRAKQKFVMEMLDTVIKQAGSQNTTPVASVDKRAASG